MASESVQSLQTAISAVERAFSRLDAAAAVAVHERDEALGQCETIQTQITHSWQQHTAQLEAALAEAQGENEFLKADALRLTQQLQALQQDYLTLRETAGHAVGRLDATVKQLDLMLEH